MAFSGSLQDFSVADIFSLLAQQKKTGLLKINSKKAQAELVINAGAITHVRFNEETPETMVKKVLVRTGKMDEKLYKELSLSALRTGKNIRDLMVAKNYLTDEENDAWYRIAMEDLILSLFFWNQGDYYFESRKMPFLSGDSICSLSMEYLMLEGVRQLDEWPDVIRKFPNEKLIFKVKIPDYQEYDLNEGLFLMNCINGRKPISALQKEVPYGAYRFFSYLAKLWKEDFIEVEESPVEIEEREEEIQNNQSNQAARIGLVILLLVCLAGLFVFRVKGYPAVPNPSSGLYSLHKKQIIQQIKLSSMAFGLDKGKAPRHYLELEEYACELKYLSAYISDSLKINYPTSLFR